MSTIVRLSIEFFLTGLFAIGGGLATIPFLVEMGEKYQWFSSGMLSTMIAVSESTPGPIGVNMATYTGYTVSGLVGSLVATLSLVVPSVIIVCIVANGLQRFKNAKIVNQILGGIKPAVVAFIVAACLDMFVSSLLHIHVFEDGWKIESVLRFFNWKNIALLAVMLMVHKKYSKVHPVFYIVAAALVGILFGL